MTAFETEPVFPKENENTSETLFTRGDFLAGMISQIEVLWQMRADAIRDQNTEDRKRIRDELYQIYNTLEQYQEDINDPSVKPETREAVEEELWLLRNHLHKFLH